MIGRLGRLVADHPVKVVLIWVVLVAAAIGFAPRLSDITNTDQTSFLPSSYESARALELAERTLPASGGESALLVFTARDGGRLSDADQAVVGRVAAELSAAGIDRVRAVTTSERSLSPNGTVQLATVALQGTAQDQPVLDAVAEIRDRLPALLTGSGLRVGVTGGAAILLDNQDAFTDAERIVAVATIGIILALLLIIFRSPVAALMPVITVGMVFLLATSLIALGGEAFGFQVGQELGSLLTVVMFGIGTDYILFLLFRVRERLRAGDDARTAVVVSVERVGEAITSAAAAVIVAFSALALSTFGSFTTLGPGLAVAVATMLAAALTLVPATISLLGTRTFWPSKGWQRTPKATLSRRLGRLVARRPGIVATSSAALLVVLGSGVAGFAANYDQISQLPSGTESTTAFARLQAGFPAGALNPTEVLLHATDGTEVTPGAIRDVTAAVGQVEGVETVLPGQASTDGSVATITVLLADSPFSTTALDVVGGPLREAAHAAAPAGTEALVGGQTSAFADVRDASNRDLRVIFPVAGLLIALILGLLLRSLVAPLYLMATVVLSFAATLGATVYAFQGVGGEPGLMFALPIILYLFVVAIGTDYNILMVARLREEAREGNDPRTAADLAVEHAGPSVGAAGLILAGTFASLMLAGVSLLTQMGFAVAIGIVLSAFVMSMFLVPALTALVGHTAWWPGHGDVDPHANTARRADEPASPPVTAETAGPQRV